MCRGFSETFRTVQMSEYFYVAVIASLFTILQEFVKLLTGFFSGDQFVTSKFVSSTMFCVL